MVTSARDAEVKGRTWTLDTGDLGTDYTGNKAECSTAIRLTESEGFV